MLVSATAKTGAEALAVATGAGDALFAAGAGVGEVVASDTTAVLFGARGDGGSILAVVPGLGLADATAPGKVAVKLGATALLAGGTGLGDVSDNCAFASGKFVVCGAGLGAFSRGPITVAATRGGPLASASRSIGSTAPAFGADLSPDDALTFDCATAEAGNAVASGEVVALADSDEVSGEDTGRRAIVARGMITEAGVLLDGVRNCCVVFNGD